MSVIGHQSRHRAAHNLLDAHTIALRHVEQQLAVGRGHSTHKGHRHLVVVGILAQVALKEAAQLLVDQVGHIAIVEMVAQEKGVSAQVAVGRRVVIHRIHDVIGCDPKAVEKRLAELLWSQPLEHIAQKDAPQRRAAALVAQDKPQRAHVAHDVLPVVQARVAARAQDARQSRLMHQQAPSRTLQVAHHRDRRLELRHQRRLHDLVLLGIGASRTIEVDMRPPPLEKRLGQLQTYVVADFAARQEVRIQAHGVGMLNHHTIVY